MRPFPGLLPWFASLLGMLLGVGGPAMLLAPAPAHAGSVMVNDPNGFQGIPWGASLADSPNLVLAEAVERTKAYDLKQGPPVLGDAKVESARFIMIDDQFARVIIRYQGKQTHDQMLAYLQSQFGPIDRTPGSMMRGLNQQFNWRGSDTEVNVTYEALKERGYVFIESRLLAPKFNEGLSETAY
ncbi:MAG: hypothetical protein HY581_11545 [Nitrospirae bacterium]|nr:hypothetical protein [Nitrospirota bacterium]